ncbi:MAG: hypothetical protein ABJZ55_02060 [Fuerstiella sp.]
MSTATKKTPAKQKAAAKKTAAKKTPANSPAPIPPPQTLEPGPPAEIQLDWDDDTQQLADPEHRARKLTKREVDALPRVEKGVLAQNLAPNCACTLTSGCNGRIVTYSTHKHTKRDDEGNAVAQVNDQYLKCTKCGRAPVNPRRVSTSLVNTKLFDRRKKRKGSES